MDAMERKRLPVTIQPLQYADINACACLTAAAFSTDRHTIVKQLGGKPFDMYEVSRNGFLDSLHNRRYIYVKAVDETGQIVGHAGWGFRGVDEEKISWKGPGDVSSGTKLKTEHNGQEESENKEGTAKQVEGDEEHEDKMSGIDRLHALEDADMADMMAELMPAGTSCMYIVGLIVTPQYQSQGVGSALIKYGTTIADHLDIFTWVHASDQSWKAYAKSGFDVVKELDVDLDEYAPAPPGRDIVERLKGTIGTGEGVTEENWGHYVIRYMKRMPKRREA